jgi:hypothetical protein
MPKILVITAPTKEKDNAVTLEEVVEPEHFESPHHAAQLIERVGWAVTDAKRAEDIAASPEDADVSPGDAGDSPNAEDLWSLTGPALIEGRVGV